MLPTNEHLGARNGTGGIAELRLEERNEFASLESRGHFARHLLLLEKNIPQLIVVIHACACTNRLLRFAQRNQSPVAHPHGIEARIVDYVCLLYTSSPFRP